MQTNRLFRKLIITTILLGFTFAVSAQQPTMAEYIQQLNHKDKAMRLYGAYALGLIGDEKAVQPLIKILKDPDVYVRAAAIDALGGIDNLDTLTVLTGLLTDENHIIRAHAANAVAKIAPQQEKEYQIRRYVKDLSDPKHIVRLHALTTLASLQPNQAAVYQQTRALADLGDADESIRRTGAQALGEVGGEQVIDPLIQGINDQSALVRGNVAVALGKLASRIDGNTVQPAIDALVIALRDADASVRSRASRALAQVGASAVQPLIAALPMSDGSANPAVVNALRWIGVPAIEALTAALDTGDASTRAVAAAVLGQIQPDSAAAYQITRSIRALRDSNPSIRAQAASRLGALGHMSDVAPLIAALGDQESHVRQHAAMALGKIGEPAIDALTPALRDGNPSMAWYAMMALGLIASKLEADARLQPAIDPLLDALEDEDISIRLMAAETLKKIGISASEQIAALLMDETAMTRAIAAAVLAAIEPDMADAYQRIRYTADLQDVQPTIRAAAARTLGWIGNAETTDALTVSLKDADPTVRRNAANALAQIGESAINPLITTLNDGEALTRWYAVVALGEIAEKMEPTASVQSMVGHLAGLLSDSDAAIRSAAIQALAKAGLSATDALIALLGSSNSSVRSGAMQALNLMGADDASQHKVTRYINDLQDSDSVVRSTAAKMLGGVGNSRAVEPLIAVLSDADYRVRWHAAETLGILGDKRAVSALESARKDDVKAVSEAAKDAASRLKRLP